MSLYYSSSTGWWNSKYIEHNGNLKLIPLSKIKSKILEQILKLTKNYPISKEECGATLKLIDDAFPNKGE